MPLNRWQLEAVLQISTTAALCLSAAGTPGGWLVALGLGLLCILGCLADRSYATSQAAGLRKRYAVRLAESCGAGLGALAIPWLLAALVAGAWPNTAGAPPAATWCRKSQATAALQLCFLSRPTCWAQQTHNGHQAGSSGHESCATRCSGLQGLCLWSGALSLAALLGCTPSEALDVLAVSAVSVGMLHLVMVCLPHTFTLGEGMVVSQALTLLANYTVPAAVRCGLLRGPAYWRCSGPASPFQAFVFSLLLASVGLAAAVAALVGVKPGGVASSGAANGLAAGLRVTGASDEWGTTRTSSGVAAPWEAVLHQRQVARTAAAAAIGAAAHPAAKEPVKGRNGAASQEEYRQWQQRQWRGLAVWRIAAALLVLVAGVAVLLRPALWSIQYALSSPGRAGLLAYWAALMALTLPAMARLAASGRVSNIIVRKGYHLLAVALFFPAAALEPQLLGISLAIAFALLAVAELARVVDAPIIGRRIHDFMTSFIDSRDSGVVLVTHFTLLLGMAVPLWLSDALALPHDSGPMAAGGAAIRDNAAVGPVPVWPAGVAGIMIIGFGDTAASIVGRRWGRHQLLPDSSKTWEGTIGGFVVTLLGWWLLSACASLSGSCSTFDAGLKMMPWPALVGATALSSLLEAVTSQLDNLFVPLHHFTLLCCGTALGRNT